MHAIMCIALFKKYIGLICIIVEISAIKQSHRHDNQRCILCIHNHLNHLEFRLPFVVTTSTSSGLKAQCLLGGPALRFTKGRTISDKLRANGREFLSEAFTSEFTELSGRTELKNLDIKKGTDVNRCLFCVILKFLIQILYRASWAEFLDYFDIYLIDNAHNLLQWCDKIFGKFQYRDRYARATRKTFPMSNTH